MVCILTSWMGCWQLLRQHIMTQKRRDYLGTVPLAQMIYVQNLVIGEQQSLLIEHFKSECIAFEKNEALKKQREQLLLVQPPILSFRDESQEKNFYEHQAQKNQPFCCGRMSQLSTQFMSDIVFSPKDDYAFSLGDGKFYAGSQKAIDEKIKQEISQTSFGGPSQNALMAGLKNFNATVAQRSQSNASVSIKEPSLSELKSPSASSMNLKPK